jgi:hypothetical protein
MTSRAIPMLAGGVVRRASGPHTLSVTVSVLASPSNLPVSRLVRLHDQLSGQLVRQVWSDATTGVAVFVGLGAGFYSASAYDHTGQYNGEITTDLVVPSP